MSAQLIFSVQPDNEVRDFSCADYSGAQLQLLYSYKLLEQHRLFLSYVHAGPKTKINIHSLDMQRSIDVETDKNRIADLTGAMILNDQIWMPAFDTKTGNAGFMCIDLNSVNK